MFNVANELCDSHYFSSVTLLFGKLTAGLHADIACDILRAHLYALYLSRISAAGASSKRGR
jgi:hypothetical protein